MPKELDDRFGEIHPPSAEATSEHRRSNFRFRIVPATLGFCVGAGLTAGGFVWIGITIYVAIFERPYWLNAHLLQFLVAVLTFAPVGVIVVSGARQQASARPVGDNRAAIGSLGIGFALDDHPAGLLPTVGLVLKAQVPSAGTKC